MPSSNVETNVRDIIDGEFIVCNHQVKLLINDKLPQYQEVKLSSFVESFMGKIEVLDAVEMEGKGLVYVADTDIPRKNES